MEGEEGRREKRGEGRVFLFIILKTKFMKGFSADAKTAYESAGAVSTEAVGGIRTVASFTNENSIFLFFCFVFVS
jgi:hypothetical protein